MDPLRIALKRVSLEWAIIDTGGSAPLAIPSDFLVRAIQQLRTAMLPIERLSLALVPVEQGCNGIQYWWCLEEPDTIRSFLRMAEFFDGQDHRTSILHHVCSTEYPKRVRLMQLSVDEVEFPLLAELHRDRFSDYLAYPLPLHGSHRVVITIATRSRDGFRASQLRGLYRLVNPLAQVLKATRHFGRGDWQSKDPLTGLISRHRFEEQLEIAFRRLEQTPLPLSLLLLDLDGFGDYNSVFGHFCADDALLAVSRLLTGRFASRTGVLARIGSDAFGLLLPGVHDSQLQMMAKELGQAVRDLRIAHPLASGPFLGCSIGLATTSTLAGPIKDEASGLMLRAEQALAEARAMKGHQTCEA